MKKTDVIDRISVLRTRTNLSARKLSTLIDKNDSYIAGLESRKDFLLSLEVLLQIISVCGSTPTEFFYYGLTEYEQDKEFIELLKSATPAAKKVAIEVLRLK